MKLLITLAAVLFSQSLWAEIPDGKYQLVASVCQNGVSLDESLKEHANVTQYVTITSNHLVMDTHSTSAEGKWYSYNCNFQGDGQISYTAPNQLSNSIKQTSCNCAYPTGAVKDWLCNNYGISLEEDVSYYEFANNELKLTRENSHPHRKYCKKRGDDRPPTNHYIKVN